jgi:hypothetical protein
MQKNDLPASWFSMCEHARNLAFVHTIWARLHIHMRTYPVLLAGAESIEQYITRVDRITPPAPMFLPQSSQN